MSDLFIHYRPTDPDLFCKGSLTFYGPITDAEIKELAGPVDVFEIGRNDRGGYIRFFYMSNKDVTAFHARLTAWTHEHDARELAAGNAEIERRYAEIYNKLDDTIEIPCSIVHCGKETRIEKTMYRFRPSRPGRA